MKKYLRWVFLGMVVAGLTVLIVERRLSGGELGGGEQDERISVQVEENSTPGDTNSGNPSSEVVDGEISEADLEHKVVDSGVGDWVLVRVLGLSFGLGVGFWVLYKKTYDFYWLE